MSLTKQQRAWFSVKIIPWFMGISNDLMFFIAINSLFFTKVKQLEASQITFLTTVSSLSYIILQKNFLSIIKKIGNTRSVRVGTLILLSSSIIMTFAKNYFMVVVGYILYQLSFMFKAMDNVMLRDNLIFLSKEHDYIKYKNKGNIIYSVVTTVISLCVGHLFSIDYYLPMYLCIAVCFINVIVSFTMTDVIESESMADTQKDVDKKNMKLGKVLIFILLFYGFIFAIEATGNTNVKLFIQEQLEENFSIKQTAKYLSYILVITRLARLFINMLFFKVYDKVRERLTYCFPLSLVIAFVAVIVGSNTSNILFKFALMVVGFCIIVGCRDSFKSYIQNLVLRQANPSEQQSCISYLELCGKVCQGVVSLMISMVLLKVDLAFIVVLFGILSAIGLVFGFKIYMLVKGE